MNRRECIPATLSSKNKIILTLSNPSKLTGSDSAWRLVHDKSQSSTVGDYNGAPNWRPPNARLFANHALLSGVVIKRRKSARLAPNSHRNVIA